MITRHIRPVRVAAAIALGASLVIPSLAAAAPAGGGAHLGLARLSSFHNPLISAHLFPSELNSGIVRLAHPAAISRTPSADITDVQQLQIALPANAQNVVQGTVAPADADNTQTNIFTAFDDQTYAASGVVGGVEQVATLPLGTTTDTALVEWLGTTYGTDAQALAKFNETVKYLTGKGLTAVSCGASPPNCDGFAVSTTDSSNKPIVILYTTFASQNAVGELALVISQDVLTADQSDVVTLFGTLVGEGFTAVGVQQQQQQSGVSIEDLALAHKVKSKLKVVKALKSGEKGYLVMLVQDQSTDTSNLQATVAVKFKGKTVRTVTLQNAGVQTDGSILFAGTFKIKTKKTKTYVAAGTAQDGSVQGAKSIKFKVKKK